MQSKHLESEPPQEPQPSPREVRRGHRALLLLSGLILLYLLVAYVILPLAWRRDTERHPDLLDGPRISHTSNGIPGDPVNVALVGSEREVIRSMIKAKWYPADPITFRSSILIAVDSVFRRPDDDAPVSTLLLFGRRQDLAFEQPIGDSPRQRHHVRFWRWDRLHDGRAVWFGAATYDERVGLSDTTGQITHHIGPDVDAERERILSELKEAGLTTEEYYVNGFHKELKGRNGGGDPWHTDGRLGVAVLVPLPGALGAVTNQPSGR
jgi:hypothetical protein